MYKVLIQVFIFSTGNRGKNGKKRKSRRGVKWSRGEKRGKMIQRSCEKRNRGGEMEKGKKGREWNYIPDFYTYYNGHINTPPQHTYTFS